VDQRGYGYPACRGRNENQSGVDNAAVIRGILQLPDASLEELAAAWQEKLNEAAPEPEPDLSAEERIAVLEAEIAQLKSALNGGV